jgi:hypothetical protein
MNTAQTAQDAGAVVTGPENTGRFGLIALARGMEFEIRTGIKMAHNVNAFAQAKQRLRIPSGKRYSKSTVQSAFLLVLVRDGIVPSSGIDTRRNAYGATIQAIVDAAPVTINPATGQPFAARRYE